MKNRHLTKGSAIWFDLIFFPVTICMFSIFPLMGVAGLWPVILFGGSFILAEILNLVLSEKFINKLIASISGENTGVMSVYFIALFLTWIFFPATPTLALVMSVIGVTLFLIHTAMVISDLLKPDLVELQITPITIPTLTIPPVLLDRPLALEPLNLNGPAHAVVIRDELLQGQRPVLPAGAGMLHGNPAALFERESNNPFDRDLQPRLPQETPAIAPTP